MTDIAATEDAPPEAGYTGYIDRVTAAGVSGWIWNPSAPDERVAVSVYEGDRLVGSTVADTFRVDLPASGVGDGAHAFEFPFLPEHGKIAPDRVSVVVEAAGYVVPRIDHSFKSPVFGELSKRVASLERIVARHQQILGLSGKPYVGPDLLTRLSAVEAAMAGTAEGLKTAELSLLRIDRHIAEADARERVASLEERVRGLTRTVYVTIGASGVLLVCLSALLTYLLAAL